MIFLLFLLIFAGVSSAALFWVAYGFPELLHLTYHVIDFCQNLLAKCTVYYDIFKLIFGFSGTAVLAIGISYGVVKGISGLIKTRRVVKRLPISGRRGHVALIKDDRSNVAFTYGLFRPTIFLSTGLLKSLDRDELKAVFLHELHHKRRLDPLRFFLLTLFKDSFFYIPVLGYFIGYIRFKKEKEADDIAVALINKPLSLASALLKVAAFNKEMAMMPAAITGGIEGGSVAGRIKRLVEGVEARFEFPGVKAVAASIGITVFLALSLAAPLNASFASPKECAIKHCAVHADKLGMNCKAHCNTSIHSHHTQ